MAFATLDTVASDPILGLMAAFQADPAVDKVDLTVGVYRDEQGNTPVMAAVAEAEAGLVREGGSKTYLPVLGARDFLDPLCELVVGPALPTLRDRIGMMQTPGGCGALRVGAELFALAQPGKPVYVSTPTWANYQNLLSGAGVPIASYPYYDPARHHLCYEAMRDGLAQAPEGSLVVLQGSCHNPTGADPGAMEWQAILETLKERRLVPFFDMAYQGLGSDLDADALPLRSALADFPEALVAVSCSKNFGLYRERTGALLWLAPNARTSGAVASQAERLTRAMYSMPPAHGALIVGRVLAVPRLRGLWRGELAGMAERLRCARAQLAAMLADLQPALDTDWIRTQQGMFSLLGISATDVRRLREERHIYMVDDSRINLAGLNDDNVARVAEAIAPLL